MSVSQAFSQPFSLQKFQHKWKSINTFEGTFTSQTTSEMFPKDPFLDTGKLYWVRLSHKKISLRYELYKSRFTILIDKLNRFIFIRPKKTQKGRSVKIYKKLPSGFEIKFLDILVDQSQIQKKFNVTELESKKPHVHLVKFAPRGPGQTFLAEISKKSYMLNTLYLDENGQKTTINFGKKRVNAQMPIDLFSLKRQESDRVVDY